MLIDDIKIKVQAGKGGKGAVAFNKNLMELGPVGGSGGRGGSIYFEGVSDLGALRQFRFKKTVAAQNGEDGRGQFRDGQNAKDLVIKIPVGTIIHNLTLGASQEITQINERIKVARGGHGGRGNFHFRSPKNTTPKEFEPGTPGESFALHLELKLIADIGLIGLPNAGKSSLLNTLTSAKAKVANYQFTTLEPNLGVYYDLILADIPGLIEGASEGKGLGIRFLRHIERTKILFHLVSADSDNPTRDYKIVRNELKNHNPALLEKQEVVFLSKCDVITKDETNKKIKELKHLNPSTCPLSILDDESIKEVRMLLEKVTSQKTHQ